MSVPLSTYRMQLRREFDFRAAARLVPYLGDLGVTHLYCSPVLQAVPGSTHGYDVVDHSRLSAELGGDAGWAELVAATRREGLGIIVDVVPNHMATDQGNAAWMDLLATGRDGEHGAWFDVDWAARDGRVLLPVLGEPYADAPVESDDGCVTYYEHEYPASDHYRLAWWRLGAEELNYRRFFDVTSLIAIRVEEPAVFDASHRRLLELVAAGDVDGLRIDHPDGLADPPGYLERLAKATGGAWVVVEKILEPDEELPADWACAGTTGYDALRRLGGVLLDPDGEQPLTELYCALTGAPASFADVVDAAKADVVERVLAPEVSRLAAVAYAAGRERDRDLSERGLRAALTAFLAGFDVYRAYLRPGEPVPPQSLAQLDAAAARALERVPSRAPELAFLRELALEHPEFAIRFQQTCGPVMAKGVEDTAFYRWFRLSSLNEVGGSPARFAVPVADFHRDNAALQRDWAASMTTLTTHDTKRSEDVRARLAVLSELPAEWGAAVTGWQARHGFGDPNLEYLSWQTLVGAAPIEAERLRGYLEKASREAKLRTSWTDPDPAYDRARDAYVREIFADRALLADVSAWTREHLLVPGQSNTLAQKLLQLAMPGVPDVYQGTECEARLLVDPDNRRPVDYARRATLLAAASPADPDAAKLLVVRRTLRLRRRLPAVFTGSYEALAARGDAADHLIGFLRGGTVAALATRLPVGLGRRGGWADTTAELPAGRWRDELTGAEYPAAVPLAAAFGALPVALLVRSGA